MKSMILTCVFVCAGLSASAQNKQIHQDKIDLSKVKVITMIGYGRDGATNQIFPNKNSLKQALAVYEAFGGTGGKIQMQNETGSLSIEADISGISIGIADSLEDIALTEKAPHAGIIPSKRGDVALKGSIADYLYNSLRIKAETRVGASLKSAGNLTCSKALVSMGKVKYVCNLRDVTFLQIEQ